LLNLHRKTEQPNKLGTVQKLLLPAPYHHQYFKLMQMWKPQGK
ncbi:hypothetical protein BAE44_0009578, partial [Dichanthelium oligosanthes]